MLGKAVSFFSEALSLSSLNSSWHPFNSFANYSTEQIPKKTKDILWVVSNCRSDTTGRMAFVKELRVHTNLTIDIYGACGEKGRVKNDRNLIKDYKFYLALENSICRDYITEKLFKVLGKGTIPVVRGAPKRQVLTRNIW